MQTNLQTERKTILRPSSASYIAKTRNALKNAPQAINVCPELEMTRKIVSTERELIISSGRNLCFTESQHWNFTFSLKFSYQRRRKLHSTDLQYRLPRFHRVTRVVCRAFVLFTACLLKEITQTRRHFFQIPLLKFQIITYSLG